MSNPIVFDASINTAGMAAGANQAEAIINKMAAQVQAKVATMNKVMGTITMGGLTGLNTFGGYINSAEKAINVTGRLSQALNRMTGIFNGGLGIGIAVGSLAALVGGFTKAIEKARDFEVAQLSIGATIQSAYKIVDKYGKELRGPDAFAIAQREAKYLNRDIIERQRKNILTYEEELQAFQAALMAGSRKGLNLKKVLDVAEAAGIVAKSTGAHGEEIGHAARLILGGGVNVSRSRIGQLLGLSNQDIKGKQGQEYYDFIMEKMKGFTAPEMTKSFSESIEGITSTLESQFDVFWARVGKGFIDKVTPAMQKLGDFLDGPGGDQLSDSFTKLFTGMFEALEKIAGSPAIPLLMKLFEFLAQNADKIVIVAALTKLVQILGAVGGATKELMAFFGGLGAKATEASRAVDKLAASNANLAKAEASVMAAGGGRAIGPIAAKKAAAQAALREEEAILAGMGPLAMMPAAGAIGLTDKQRKALANMPLAKRDAAAGKFMAQNLNMEAFARMEQEIEMVRTWQMAQVAKVAELRAASNVRVPLGERMATGWANMKMAGAAALPMLGKMGGNALKGVLITQLGDFILPENITNTEAWNMAQWGIPIGYGLAPAIPGLITKSKQLGPMSTTGLLKSAGTKIAGGASSLWGSAAATIAGAGGGLAGLKALGGITLSGAGALAAVAGVPLIGIGSIIAMHHYARSMNKAFEQEAEATKAAADIVEAYPVAAEIAKTKRQRQMLAEDLKAGLTESRSGLNLEDGRGERFLKNYDEKLKKLQKENKFAAIEPDNLVGRGKQMEAQAKYLATLAGVGYGPEQFGRQLRAESALRKAKIEQMYIDEQITDAQKTKLQTEVDNWAKDQRTKESIDKKRLEASLKAPSLQNKLSEGLLGVEAAMLPWKSKLPAEEYQKFLATAKKRFEEDFNMPLKKTEQEISALSMGVSSENVAESVKLAYKATELKLKEMRDVSQEVKDKVLKQRFAQMEVDLALFQDAMHNQSFGRTDIARIYGRGDQQLHLASYKRQQMLAGAANMNMLQQALAFGEDIQNARSVLAPEQLWQYAQNQYRNTRSNIKSQFFNMGEQRWQLEMQARQAATAARTWNWNLTDFDQMAMDFARKQAAWEEAERRGPIDYEDLLEMARQELRDQKSAADHASAQASKALQEFNTKFPTGQVAEDFNKAMEAATKALNDLADDIGRGQAKGETGRTTNNFDIKIDPKVGLTDKEKVSLAEEVKQRICRELRASGSRG